MNLIKWKGVKNPFKITDRKFSSFERDGNKSLQIWTAGEFWKYEGDSKAWFKKLRSWEIMSHIS